MTLGQTSKPLVELTQVSQLAWLSEEMKAQLLAYALLMSQQGRKQRQWLWAPLSNALGQNSLFQFRPKETAEETHPD